MAKRKSKKSTFRYKWHLIFSVIIVVFAISSWLLYKKYRSDKAKWVRYPAFGIKLPENYQIHGIDVSWYQNYVDWNAVKEMKVNNIKIGFAFIKSTEGLTNIDKNFKRNWKKVKEAGIPRGAYHFFLPYKSGKLQAENFISNVNMESGDLPPVIDIEHLYGTAPGKMRKEVKDWLNIVEQHYKVKPIIYTSVNFYTNYLAGEFDEYPLWAAHYLEKYKPRIKRPWVFWQHNERGRVNGIVTRVDFNVFNGDSSDFKQLLVK